MKTPIKFLVHVALLCMHASCGQSDDTFVRGDADAIVASVNGVTVTTSEAFSHATLAAGDGFKLANIGGVNDDVTKQFQIMVTTFGDFEGAYKVTATGEIPTVAINYIEYNDPEDTSDANTWRSTSGEVVVFENGENRFSGSFTAVLENPTLGAKSVDGMFDVKKNPFGSD